MRTASAVSWDPYDLAWVADPYPTYRRLRDEAPLYYNERHDFYAVSRFVDCDRGLPDTRTFCSAGGRIMELITSGMEIPSGTGIVEDPPRHDLQHGFLVRVFTRSRIAALEPRIRAFCARVLDPLVDEGGFDLITQFGADFPMRVVGMVLGIPEADLPAIRHLVDDTLAADLGGPMNVPGGGRPGEDELGDYLDRRRHHHSNDLMTDLLNVQLADQSGRARTLTRDEVRASLTFVARAGNATRHLIGWIGSVLASHPGQRRLLVDNPFLIPNAVEEILRLEPPNPFIGRYVAKDVEFHGRRVPAGSAILFLVASANRDERRYSNGDRFDITRRVGPQLTFELGGHYHLSAALARLEGRVAMEEILKRFPSWDVDWDNATLARTSTVRGWETLPISIG